MRDYGLSVSHLCVILTPESRKNLNVTPALEDSLLARVREAAALYSPETQLLLNPAEETLRGIFAEADVVVGTGDFTLEGMGAPLIPAVNETTSLSFPSYVRTVRRTVSYTHLVADLHCVPFSIQTYHHILLYEIMDSVYTAVQGLSICV